MVNEILNIVKEYHEDEKYADDYFVIRICDIIIDHYDLIDYIEGICINNNINGNNSRFLFTKNIIEFNLFRLHNKELMQKYDNSYYDIFNLMVLKTIFHELEHVNQERIKDKNENSIRKKLLLLGDPTSYIIMPEKLNPLSFKTHKYYYEWLKYRYYYNKYYYAAPNERMAILLSCIKINEILESDYFKENIFCEEVKKNNDKDLNIIMNNYVLRGEITNCPSLEYLFKQTKDNRGIILIDKSFYNFNLSVLDRVFYGLMLSENEYNNLPDIKKELVKRKDL